MTDHNQRFGELKAFIREHRSNESNFDILYQRLQKEQAQATSQQENGAYAASLQEIMDKQATEFRTAKENGGSAWPEYENFISEWERAIAAASGGTA